MHPNCSLPSLPLSLPQCSLPPSLPQIHCSSVSLQKGAGFPTISTEHGITRWNKLVTNPYIKTGKASQGNLVKEKGFQEQTRVRNTPSSTVRSPTPQTKQSQHVCSGSPITDAYRLSDCLFSLCEPLWTLCSWFTGLCSPGILSNFGSHNPSSCLLCCSFKLHLMLGLWVSPSPFISCWRKPF